MGRGRKRGSWFETPASAGSSPCGERGVANSTRRANHFGFAESCQAPKRKIFRFTGILICGISAAVPGPQEGRFAVVTERRARDAMDAVASGGLWLAGRNVHGGRRSRVVLAPRPWRQAGVVSPTPATVARKAASP